LRRRRGSDRHLGGGARHGSNNSGKCDGIGDTGRDARGGGGHRAGGNTALTKRRVQGLG
jgi:hypothetical protein